MMYREYIDYNSLPFHFHRGSTMDVKKEKYYIAASPNKTASSPFVYRQARYGVKVELFGIKYYATGFTLEEIIKNPHSGFILTEARTGYGITVKTAMLLPQIIKEVMAKKPDVKTYPLMTARQMKQLQNILEGKGEG